MINRVITVPVTYQKWLEERCLSYAGPKPNVTGMRNKYWGKDAYIIRCGLYIYKVNQDTYYICLGESNR